MVRIYAIALVAIFFSGPALPWFFQPPPGEQVSEETVRAFSEASQLALNSFSELYLVFAEVERDELPIGSSERLLSVIQSLEAASQSFSDLPADELSVLMVDERALMAVDPGAVPLVRELGVSSAADMSAFAEVTCSEIANALRGLLETSFGPEVPSDPVGRTAVNEVSNKISIFLIVLNSVSGALAWSF